MSSIRRGSEEEHVAEDYAKTITHCIIRKPLYVREPANLVHVASLCSAWISPFRAASRLGAVKESHVREHVILGQVISIDCVYLYASYVSASLNSF